MNGQVESPVSILLRSFLFKEGLADILAKVGTSTRIHPNDPKVGLEHGANALSRHIKYYKGSRH